MNLSQKTILIIDDDVDYLMQMKMSLQEYGINIITSETSSKAKELIQHEKFDAVIVDLMMEDMDAGLILSYEIKKKSEATPVIMVTAVINQTGLEFGNAHGGERQWVKADKVMAKPVRPDQLIKELEKMFKANS